MKKILIYIFALLILTSAFIPIFNPEISNEKETFKNEINSKGFKNIDINISSERAILYHKDTGLVLYSKNEDKKSGMASTTKIMTAIIILESMRLDEQICITKESVGIEGSSLYLKEDEIFTVESLLYGLLLQSGNDVACALAIAHSGSIENFADKMNEKADDLKMVNTNFSNPHGLSDENHYSTARDMGLLSIYAMDNEIFRKIVSTKKYTVKPLNNDNIRYCVNHNKLLFNQEIITGIKTGYTKKDGRCLVTSATKDGIELICVTLNGQNHWNDHQTMINYGFDSFEKRILANKGEYASEISVVGGKENKILASNISNIELYLPKDSDVIMKIVSPPFVYAPVKKGDDLGEIRIYVENRVIYSFPLCATENVKIKKISLFKKIFG